MIRAILAVLAGIVLWGVVWTGGHAVLTAIFPGSHDEDGFTQSAGLLLVYLFGSVVPSLCAGYAAAWIAKLRPMRVVAVLAAIQLVIGIVVQAGVWDRAPVWYHVPFLLMVVPAHVLGGWLRAERRAPASA